MARSKQLGLSVVCATALLAAGCGVTADPAVEAGGTEASVSSATIATVPSVPMTADSSTTLTVAYVPDGYAFDRELRPKSVEGNLVITQFFMEIVGNRLTPAGPVGRSDVVVNVANVPGLADRNITDPANLITPGGDPTLESRTSVQGVPAAVLAEPVGPVINHIIIFARGEWIFQIISPTVTVDELLRVAEAVSLR